MWERIFFFDDINQIKNYIRLRDVSIRKRNTLLVTGMEVHTWHSEWDIQMMTKRHGCVGQIFPIHKFTGHMPRARFNVVARETIIDQLQNIKNKRVVLCGCVCIIHVDAYVWLLWAIYILTFTQQLMNATHAVFSVGTCDCSNMTTNVWHNSWANPTSAHQVHPAYRVSSNKINTILFPVTH